MFEGCSKEPPSRFASSSGAFGCAYNAAGALARLAMTGISAMTIAMTAIVVVVSEGCSTPHCASSLEATGSVHRSAILRSFGSCQIKTESTTKETAAMELSVALMGSLFWIFWELKMAKTYQNKQFQAKRTSDLNSAHFFT